MPGATDPIIAAQAMALGDMGYTGPQVGNALKIPGRTAREIIARHGRWGEVDKNPVFAQLRREQIAVLEAQSRRMAALALVQCEDQLPKANAYQACLISSIMIDKSQLLAGLPTEITLNVNASVDLDSLLDKLGHRLIETNAEIVK